MMFPMATNARCNLCHSLPPIDISNGNLSMGMDKDSAYMALVGKQSTSSKCSGMTLVVPGKPDDEPAYAQKLIATPPCGDRMPLGGNAVHATRSSR